MEVINQITEIDDDYRSYLDRLPKERREKIFKSVSHTMSGSHAVAPITCLGASKCPFIAKCPIPTIVNGVRDLGPDSLYPIGQECILEKFFIQQKVIEYIQYLNIDPMNPIEMSIANELALLDLYKNRALMILSTGDNKGDGRDFMKTDIVGFSEQGSEASISKIHPITDMIAALERRRDRWITQLVESRKAKQEMAIKRSGGVTETKILDEIARLRNTITQLEYQPELKQITSNDDIEIE